MAFDTLAHGPHALKIELAAAPGGQARLSSYLVSIPGDVKLEDMDLGRIVEARAGLSDDGDHMKRVGPIPL